MRVCGDDRVTVRVDRQHEPVAGHVPVLAPTLDPRLVRTISANCVPAPRDNVIDLQREIAPDSHSSEFGRVQLADLDVHPSTLSLERDSDPSASAPTPPPYRRGSPCGLARAPLRYRLGLRIVDSKLQSQSRVFLFFALVCRSLNLSTTFEK